MKTIKFETVEMIDSWIEGGNLADEIKTVFSLGKLEYLGTNADGFHEYAWNVPSAMHDVCEAMLSILVNTDSIYQVADVMPPIVGGIHGLPSPKTN